jgi:hypothetical protein
MKTKKGFSVVEYTLLFVIIISAFLVMRNYIQRGIYGTWGKAGQSFGYGRQFDPQKSIECSFDEQSNVWYDRNCFEAQYNQTCTSGDIACEEGIITGTCHTSECAPGQ